MIAYEEGFDKGPMYGIKSSRQVAEAPAALTYDEAADFLKISRRTLERVVRRKLLRPRRFGRRVVFARSALLRYLDTDLTKA